MVIREEFLMSLARDPDVPVIFSRNEIGAIKALGCY